MCSLGSLGILNLGPWTWVLIAFVCNFWLLSRGSYRVSYLVHLRVIPSIHRYTFIIEILIVIIAVALSKWLGNIPGSLAAESQFVGSYQPCSSYGVLFGLTFYRPTRWNRSCYEMLYPLLLSTFHEQRDVNHPQMLLLSLIICVILYSTINPQLQRRNSVSWVVSDCPESATRDG